MKPKDSSKEIKMPVLRLPNNWPQRSDVWSMRSPHWPISRDIIKVVTIPVADSATR